MRNDDYWRGPNGITGEDLPYLDAVEIVVAVDIDSRSSSLRSGQFDIIHTSNADESPPSSRTTASSRTSATVRGDELQMLNVAEGPNATTGKPLTGGANADSPLLHLSAARRWPWPSTTTATTRSVAPAWSRWPTGRSRQGSIGYLEDTGYPKFDLEGAVAEIDKCLAGVGHRQASR